jgi:hypothetical protein
VTETVGALATLARDTHAGVRQMRDQAGALSTVAADLSGLAGADATARGSNGHIPSTAWITTSSEPVDDTAIFALRQLPRAEPPV